MGYGRTAHARHGCNIQDTLLAVAENPEDTQPAGVSQKLHGFRHGGDSFAVRHVGKNVLFPQVMAVGQIHGDFSGHAAAPFRQSR